MASSRDGMLALYLLGAAFATEPSRGASLYARAVELVDDHYLRLESFSTRDAFVGAAEALEESIPWLIVEERGASVVLTHGVRGEFASLEVGGNQVDDLIPALVRLEQAVTLQGEPVPAGVDVPVEILKGMALALDPHSTVLTEERLERFDERISGKLTGIGSTIGKEASGAIIVKDVYRGGPADKGGVISGDVVVRIDGVSTVGMTVAQATERIRGAPETAVVLAVRRTTTDGPAAESLHVTELELPLVRAEIVVPNVVWSKLPSGLGLIRIDHFSEQTVTLLRDAVAELQRDGVTGLALDLRGNAGGSMLQSAECADLFVTEGTLLRTVGRGGRRVANLQSYMQAEDQGTEPDVPVVVLIDGGSASASEILAGDLVLLDRAVIVGERSYGKGTVQKVYTLEEDKVRLKLTVAEYRLVGDTPVTEAGLVPDLALQPVTFDFAGVDIPTATIAGAVMTVDERPGWRGISIEASGNQSTGGIAEPDLALDLAQRIVETTTGAHRADLLAAVETVRADVRREQNALMIETMRLRGIDWTAGLPASPSAPGSASATAMVSATDTGAAAPSVRLQLSLVDAAIAGGSVELRAYVDNQGTTDVERGVVRLSTVSGEGPWDGIELPVGRVGPGQTGFGRAVVRLPMLDGNREDVVTASLDCEACGSNAMTTSTVMSVKGVERPAVTLSAQWVPERSRVAITLVNEGHQALKDVRAHFSFPEESEVELVDREASLATLGAGGRAKMDLGLALASDLAGPLDLELVVESELYTGTLAHRFALALPLDGSTVHLESPALASAIPASLPTGFHPLEFRAVDDVGVQSMTVWYNGEKLAWREGSGRRLSGVVPLTVVGDGPHMLTVDLVDAGGVERVLRYPIRGEETDGSAVAFEAVALEPRVR